MASTAATIDVQLRANTAAYRSEMVQSARTTTQQLGLIRKEASQTAVSIANLNRAAVGFVGFEAVKSGVSALLDAQKSIQQIHYGLMGATGSAAAADKAYGFVSQTAKDLGLNLEDAAKSFTRMTAAASANGIGMQDQQELFRQLSRSATVMHLSADETGRATTALGQSFSKGKFQAEELRQQLGEAIPGIVPRFMQAVAKMNEGTALAGKSFDKLLQDGDLNVQKYLPAMIQALREAGAGAEEASKGLNAELNRLSTAWFKLKADASSGVFSDAAISSVRLMAENLDKVAGAATIAAGAVAGRLIGAGAKTAYGAVASPISDRIAAASQAAEMSTLALARSKDSAAQVEQARSSLRLATAWQAQSAAGQETARSQLAIASAAHEAAQRTLEHQSGAATLSANLRAQREAEAALVITQRNMTRAQVEYNAAVTSGNRADAASVAAKGRLIRAQEAAALATNNLAAARAKEAAAGAASSLGGIVASGARSAGAGLLALAGGPWGAAAIAIGGMGMAFVDMARKSAEARAEYQAQIKGLDLLRLSMTDTVDQYNRGGKSIGQLADEWNTSSQAMKENETRIKALQAAVDNYQARIKLAQTSTREGSGLTIAADYEGLQNAQAELAKFQTSVAPVRQEFLRLESSLKSALDPSTFEALKKAAQEADDANFQKLRAALPEVKRLALDAAGAMAMINSSASDAVWKQQVEYIRKTKGEYQAWLTEQGKAINAAGGVNAMTPEARAQFNKTAESMKRYIDLNKAADEARKAGIASLRDQVADGKQQENQYTSIIDRIQRQIALDKEQMALTDDMTAAQKLQVVVTNEMASAKSKLSEEEQTRIKTLLAEAVAQGKAQAAQEAAKKAAKDMLTLQKELNEAAATQQQANAIDLAGIGTGSEQMEAMRRQLQLKEEYDRRLSALNDRNASANNGNGYTKKQYAQQLAELDSFYQSALEREAQYQANRQRYISDWTLGASRAFEDYASQAANTAELTNQVFTNAFQGLEDAFVNFAMTGKLRFGELAKSILADLARIAAKQAAMSMFGAAFNAIVGSTVGPVQREGVGLQGWDTGGYTGPGGKHEPAGIVHKGEGVLSQEDMRALGGPSAFHSLRAALRRGYSSGGVVGQSVAPVTVRGASAGFAVEINNYAGATVKQREENQSMPDGSVLRKLILDVVSDDVVNGGQVAMAGRSRFGWDEVTR